MKVARTFLSIGFALAVAACATTSGLELSSRARAQVEPGSVLKNVSTSPELEERILALDPERVADSDVRNVLAHGPTPRIMNIHGGIYPVHLVMESFAEFLIGMGYPEQRIRHPGDGRLSHSPYENSAQIAGLVAWHYEHDGMMPLIIGHSQGGIQAVKVLHELAGNYSGAVHVWDPYANRAEERTTLVDPYTGRERPVVGLKVRYASAVGSGGAALLLPNQWSMAVRLRTIPDSVEEFTGYTLAVDLVAWDLPGVGAVYKADGTAKVRNVELPADYNHVTVASASHLANDPEMRAWVNAFAPGQVNGFPATAASTENALWAGDVWYHVKKHWVLEAQRLIRAKQQASE